MTRLLWLCAVLLLSPPAFAEVPSERLYVLARGINITAIDDHIATQRSIPALKSDLSTIHHAGFRHVRMFVNLDWLSDNLATNWRIARLDTIVEAATHEHLATILCLYSERHPMGNAATDATVQQWWTAWRQLAEHYHTTSPNDMFFEIANEPDMDGTRWSAVQEQLRATIRYVVPKHTLLLTASPLSMSWSFDNLTLVEDTNLLYVFHLYQPMVFTHQSADWSDPAYHAIKGLEYPPNPANIRGILANPLVAANPDSVRELKQYEQIGDKIMGDEIAHAVQWAQQHAVPVMVTEFGNDATVAPQASRAAWLGAARRRFEAAGFGWSVWQYDGAFGIKADLEHGCDLVVKALGLCQ